MKKTLLLFLLCFFATIAFAQEVFYVLHVSGQVKSGDKTLKVKDKISAKDEIQFSSESAFLVVFSNTSGKKVVKPVKQAETTTSLISYFVNENMLPAQNQLSTRGSDEMNSFSDLKNYFESTVLVIDTLDLTINKSSLGINENNFLVISTSEAEVAGIYADAHWKISIDELSSLGNEQKVLSYKDNSFGSSMPICEVKFILRSLDQISDEINYFEELAGTRFDEVSLKDHMETVYGKFDTDYLPILLK